jgi:uncharacterized protein YbjQ (UPF0145 family)
MAGRNDNDDQRAMESLRAIEAGGLPPAAAARLAENAARQGTPDHIFTSNLSTGELLLTEECGYEPLGQVMGCCVYHVGWQGLASGWGGYSGWNRMSQELGVLTQAYFDARHLCFGRLEQEAAILRADGVVGVRFERSGADLPSGNFEFKAVGTAVRSKGAKTAPPTSSPFVSNLNGQDHWSLRQAGLRPVGFAFGNCSWYQVAGWRNQMLNNGSWVNGELSDFTKGVYTAREIALERLSVEAGRLGALGVVGMVVEPTFEPIEYEMNNMRYEDLLVQFTIYGTAIAYEIGRPVKFDVVPVVSLES